MTTSRHAVAGSVTTRRSLRLTRRVPPANLSSCPCSTRNPPHERESNTYPANSIVGGVLCLSSISFPRRRLARCGGPFTYSYILRSRGISPRSVIDSKHSRFKAKCSRLIATEGSPCFGGTFCSSVVSFNPIGKHPSPISLLLNSRYDKKLRKAYGREADKSQFFVRIL